MSNFYTRNLVGTQIWYGTLHFDYFRYKCKMPVKERKNFTLSYALRKRKRTLASLIISIFIQLLQRETLVLWEGSICSLQYLKREKKFHTDVLHITCWLGGSTLAFQSSNILYRIRMDWVSPQLLSFPFFPGRENIESHVCSHIKGKMGCALLQEASHQLS